MADLSNADYIIRGLIFATAGLAAGLLATVGPTYLRLAVKIRNNYSVMTTTAGRASILCGVAGVFLIAIANLFGVASRQAALEPLTWRTYAILAGFTLIDITLVIVAIYVRKQRKELKTNGD